MNSIGLMHSHHQYLKLLSTPAIMLQIYDKGTALISIYFYSYRSDLEH